MASRTRLPSMLAEAAARFGGWRAALSFTKSGTRTLGHGSDKHEERAELLARALSTGFSSAGLRQLMVAASVIALLVQGR